MLDVQVSRGVCLLRLDAPPLNTLTFELLTALRDAIEQAERDGAIRGLILTGGADQFSAGADIHLFETIASPAAAAQLSRTFQEAFQRVEDCRKPLAVALAGNVVGGALELAMACGRRIAARGARLGLPEVKLGIIPGAGGTQRLPRLVGPRAALRMMLNGEILDARTACELGLVDAVCAGDELLERARDLALADAAPPRARDRNDKIPEPRELAAILRDAEAMAAAARPEIIAPRNIVEAVRVGLRQSFAEGLARERQGFADCMGAAAARNKIHLFFATRQVAKLPELTDARIRPVRSAAVVGMGTMGTGIAHALIAGGLRVRVLDEQPAAVAKGVERIRVSLARRVADGKLPAAQRDAMLANLIPATDCGELSGADVIIESVYEDLAIKQAVLSRLEQVGDGAAILASNTSTISLDELSAGLRRRERLVGMHFFNPAQRMPLVELIRRADTPPEILATLLQLCKSIRKTPVVVCNRAGFLVSRLFVPYVQEAFTLLEEGRSPRTVDRAAVEFGFPMGPLALIDMAGLDILAHTQRILRNAFPHHGDLSRIATRLVEMGHLGQKTGGGVYRYDAASHDPLDSETTANLLRETSGAASGGGDTSALAERLALRMVGEAFRALEEGVARCAADVDVATVLGVGFPDFRGGACRYARDLGWEPVRRRLEEFTRRYGPRYAPCGLLTENQGV